MKGRLLSIDVLRGLTIIFMIIVNQPGSWDHVYSPLLHAEWNGLTPTDYIFPMFLFIVGVSIVLSMSKRLDSSNRSSIIKKVIWRAVKIYLVGLFLWVWPDFDFNSVRWTGVLQRISVVFLFCGLIYLFFKQKQQVYIEAIILILYWIIMVFASVPLCCSTGFRRVLHGFYGLFVAVVFVRKLFCRLCFGWITQF